MGFACSKKEEKKGEKCFLLFCRVTNDAREDEMDNNIQEVSNMVGNLRNMVRDPKRSVLLLLVKYMYTVAQPGFVSRGGGQTTFSNYR